MNLAKRWVGTKSAGLFWGQQNNLVPSIPQACPETVFLDPQSVSSYQIDELGELQRNWIGVLWPDWKIDSSGCSLAVAEVDDVQPRDLTLHQLISLTQQSGYELTEIDQEYWIHTLCSRVVGLGRLRLVLCFDNPDCMGESVVLGTNRLDWSPRKILTQWLEYSQSRYQKYSPEYRQSFSFSSGEVASSHRALMPAL
jgi:hypothetical protein